MYWNTVETSRKVCKVICFQVFGLSENTLFASVRETGLKHYHTHSANVICGKQALMIEIMVSNRNIHMALNAPWISQ